MATKHTPLFTGYYEVRLDGLPETIYNTLYCIAPRLTDSYRGCVARFPAPPFDSLAANLNLMLEFTVALWETWLDTGRAVFHEVTSNN